MKREVAHHDIYSKVSSAKIVLVEQQEQLFSIAMVNDIMCVKKFAVQRFVSIVINKI